MPIVILLVDIIVFYTVFIHIKDTEKTTGTRIECRRIGRGFGGYGSTYSCTYRYRVRGVEYNNDDILTCGKKFPAGIETEIYYKKNDPEHIITKAGIMNVMKILAAGNIAAFCFMLILYT